jgi:two-component system OmpR family sensor kinase
LPQGLLEGTEVRQGGASFDTHSTASGLVRVYTKPYRSRAGRAGLVRVLEQLGDVEQPLRTLRNLLVLMAPVALVVAFAGGYWLSDRALRPVDRVASMARDIDAHDLSLRLPVPAVRDELGRLVETLNQMIARLEGSFAGMKRFTADASHELRTPLASIGGTVDVVLAHARSPEEYVLALRSIAEDVHGLRVIIDDLLVLAQADAGSATTRREPVRLDVVVAEVAEGSEAAAAAVAVAVAVRELAGTVVTGDEPWLRQLVSNVVGNAVKFSGHGGGAPPRTVDVALRHEGAEAVLTVTDDGPGIADSDLPRLFDRFYRGDGARTRGEGVGLGLAICHWVVTAHGGTIDLRNAPGRGAICTVRLPLVG